VSGALHELWRARWNLLRWSAAAFCLWVAVADTGARLARLQLAALPDYDAAPDVARLREQGRYGEAVVMADAAIEHASPERAAALRRERDLALGEQQSWLRRAKDLGRGALTGGAGSKPGEMSLEMLIGAVGADMLVVGDIRDLAIQSYKFASGGEVDPVIAALSAIGLATTLAPEIDWAPSVLKAARRVGSIGDKLGEFIVKSVKGRKVKEIEALLTDSAQIAKKSSPGSAVRLLRLAEGPEDVARISRFVQREGKAGAAALHMTGESGAAALKAADGLRAAGRLEEAARLEGAVMRAAQKGPAGGSWLKRGGYAALLRPHPIIGAIKGVYKGNAAALVQRALETLDPMGWWIVPLLAAWLVLETGLLLRRFGRRAEAAKPVTAGRAVAGTAA